MAISTGAAVEEFGTQTAVITTAGTVSGTAITPSSDSTTFTNTDNAVSAAFVFVGSYTVAPDLNSSVDLYAQLLDVQSTNDTVEPTATYLNQYISSFPLIDATGSQTLSIIAGLPNVKAAQQYNFFIVNNAGQTLSAGANVYITDTAINTKA